jgi:hypothetical protein
MEYRLRKARCVNCATPAVAVVDGECLCEGCLLSLVLSSEDNHRIERVESASLAVERVELTVN